MVLRREWPSILTPLGDFRFARQSNRLSTWLNAYGALGGRPRRAHTASPGALSARRACHWGRPRLPHPWGCRAVVGRGRWTPRERAAPHAAPCVARRLCGGPAGWAAGVLGRPRGPWGAAPLGAGARGPLLAPRRGRSRGRHETGRGDGAPHASPRRGGGERAAPAVGLPRSVPSRAATAVGRRRRNARLSAWGGS
jgi:hypothetical protein